MTGFGSASGAIGRRGLTAEVRSVNARFLDMTFRLPPRWEHLEGPLAKAVRARISRGKVVVSVFWQGGENNGGALSRMLYRSSARELRAIQPGSVSRSDILQVLSAGVGNSGGLSPHDHGALCITLVEQAIDGLIRAREAEGKEIHAEFTAQLDAIGACMTEVEALTPEIARETKKRLETAMRRLGDAGVDALADTDRISREVALLLVRSDAREEVVRVQAHVSAWRERMDTAGPHGKMLEFLLQEMQRELNTLAGKTTLLEVTRLTLAARALVDQMREQVANVE
ncbi:DUF1732 domain-containing protein [Candidatus Fermentibacteria bacterium]|nr:DUF1732 domain-containing protein [Candidatus Fermentibacteria bacterium]